MAARGPKSSAPDSSWQAFQARHPGHRFLTEDPLYALTEEVVTAIADQLPGFLSADDEAFERDLARTSGGGFFHGRPIGGLLGPSGSRPAGARAGGIPAAAAPTDRLAELLASDRDKPLTVGQFLDMASHLTRFPPGPVPAIAPPLRPEWDPTTVTGNTIEHIRELLAELRVAGGEPPAIIQEREAAAADERLAVRDKQEAYAMWLVLQSDYRADIDAFRLKWERQVRAARGFPSLHEPTPGPGAGDGFGPTCRKLFRSLYARWGLEGLLTWELPLPLDPVVVRADGGAAPPDRRTGVTVFLPWYVLKGTRLDVSALVRRTRDQEAPEHLAAWFDRPVKKGTRLASEISLRQKFWLYRTHTLVLARRYGAKLARNLEKVELALAGVMGQGPDLLRKLRQSLARELKRAATT